MGDPSLAGSSRGEPGSQVRWLAERMGWPIQECNVVVEGKDCEYFELAANLYEGSTGRQLLSGLAIFPTGDGDEGGTHGILRHFPTLRNMIDLDFDPTGRKLFRAIALLDGDAAGKYASRGLTAQHTRLVAYRDVFLLARRMPRTTKDVKTLANAFDRENAEWKAIDCEIEDLLNREFIECFLRETPGALRRKPVIVGAGHHYEFAEGIKPSLLRFTKSHALLADVENIVDVLKSLRFYLGCDPEG